MFLFTRTPAFRDGVRFIPKAHRVDPKIDRVKQLRTDGDHHRESIDMDLLVFKVAWETNGVYPIHRRQKCFLNPVRECAESLMRNRTYILRMVFLLPRVIPGWTLLHDGFAFPKSYGRSCPKGVKQLPMSIIVTTV